MSGDAPDAPDYRGAAIQQGESAERVNTEQTFANRPNQYTPFGSSTWTPSLGMNPATGEPITQWDQTLELTEASQQALDDQQSIGAGRSALSLGLMGQAASDLDTPQNFWDSLPDVGTTPNAPQYGGGLTAMGSIPGRTQPVNFEGMMGPSPEEVQRGVGGFGPQAGFGGQGSIGASVSRGQGPQGSFGGGGMMQQGLDFGGAGGIGTGANTRNRVEDATYGRSTSRLDPQWGQAAQQLESKLVNQGLRPGDAAYDQQMDNFSRQRNDAYAGARQDAIISGGAEATREFGMDLGRRQQSVGETTTQGQFANQAQNQQFQQALGRGQFGNQAQAQEFGQSVTASELSNRAQGQRYSEALGRGQFGNQAAAQGFGQDVTAGQFGNQAQAQQFGQAAALRGEAGAAAGAQFDQALAQTNLRDRQRQQQVGEQLALGGQGFGQEMQRAQHQQQLRQQAVAEQLQREGWSLNKINALLSGQQVNAPQMPNFQGAGRAEGTQFLAAANMQGQADLDAYNAEQSAKQGLMAGIGSIAGGFSGFA